MIGASADPCRRGILFAGGVFLSARPVNGARQGDRMKRSSGVMMRLMIYDENPENNIAVVSQGR